MRGSSYQMRRLEGKVSIVTGAGSGIGSATAMLFASEGASVAILDRDERTARATESKIRATGSAVYSWTTDLSDVAKAENVINQVARQFGRIDILVNNAAIYIGRSLEEMKVEEWRKVLEVNLTAYFVCARTSAKQMSKRGGGSIVNISSVQRSISEPNSAAYAVSKAAIGQLTRNLAIELAPANIVVNSISPGFVRTGMSIVNGVDETTTPRFKTLYIESGRIPLRRPGVPQEVAAAAMFLASRECGYLTGADVVIDGGLSVTL